VTVTVDGTEVPAWTPVTVPAGGTLDVGTAGSKGLRGYILFQGGLDIPQYLGSASTFTLGQFGGHAGRVLRAGDVLRAVAPAVSGPANGEEATVAAVPLDSRPALTSTWELTVGEGPHGAPEFFQR